MMVDFGYWLGYAEQPVPIEERLSRYQCPRCEVWGRGDRCWCCGSDEVIWGQRWPFASAADQAGSGTIEPEPDPNLFSP
jgi:hypothetical protein